MVSFCKVFGQGCGWVKHFWDSSMVGSANIYQEKNFSSATSPTINNDRSLLLPSTLKKANSFAQNIKQFSRSAKGIHAILNEVKP
jgi:hypothetical protein